MKRMANGIITLMLVGAGICYGTGNVEGFVNGILMASETVVLNNNLSWWDFSNFENIWVDTLVFMSVDPVEQFVMDDFTYNPIPEPETLSMMLIRSQELYVQVHMVMQMDILVININQ